MDETKPERNPLTHRKHRMETFWQVSFPLILGCILVIGLAAWTVIIATSGGGIRKTADISLVFLIIPAMVMALIPLAIFIGMAYAVIWLNQNTPYFMKKAQDTMTQVRDGVRNGSDKFAEPVIRFKSRIASLEALQRKK
jgi:hypothetical protein